MGMVNKCRLFPYGISEFAGDRPLKLLFRTLEHKAPKAGLRFFVQLSLQLRLCWQVQLIFPGEHPAVFRQGNFYK